MEWIDFFAKLGSLDKYHLRGLSADIIRKPFETFYNSETDEEREFREKLYQILQVKPEGLKKLLTNENVEQKVIHDLIEIIENTPKPEPREVIKSINFWVENNSIEDFTKIYRFIMNNMFIYRNYDYTSPDVSVILENIRSLGVDVDAVIFDYTFKLFELMVIRGLCTHFFSPSKIQRDFIDFGLTKELNTDLIEMISNHEETLRTNYSRYSINLISNNLKLVIDLLKELFKRLQ